MNILQLTGRGTGAMGYGGKIGPFGSSDDRGTIIAKDGVVDHYLQKELKIELYKKQQTSLVEALKTPEKWLAARDASLKTITEELAPIYYDAIEKYRELYPVDEAVELANRDIKSLYEVKMRQLEVEQPGASLLFQGAVLENNKDKILGNAFLSGGSQTSKEEFKRYYKEKRARKKAKKSKKLTQ